MQILEALPPERGETASSRGAEPRGLRAQAEPGHEGERRRYTSTFRNFCNALRICVFTVPTGRFCIWAICS